MYVAREQWSTPEEGDPPPCFRQGDLVRLTWVRPEATLTRQDTGVLVRISNLEVRTEVVALLSACCDLVIRPTPKRKGAVISPLREVPKQFARNPSMMAALKTTVVEATATKQPVPANIAYYAPVEIDGQTRDGVVHLEAVAMIDYSTLRSAEKIAELNDAARAELQERIKNNFTRSTRH